MTTCAECKYFVHENGPYGQCHWQPPAPVWAKVSPRDWCGQFAAAPAAPQAPQPAPYAHGTAEPVRQRRKGGAA